MKKETVKLIACVAFGAALAFGTCVLRGILHAGGTTEILTHLADGFFFTGAVIGGFGLLKWARNQGQFDGMSYLARKLFSKGDNKPVDYAGYREQKSAARTSARIPLITGAIYVGLSLVMLALWYASYTSSGGTL